MAEYLTEVGNRYWTERHHNIGKEKIFWVKRTVNIVQETAEYWARYLMIEYQNIGQNDG
jgi:hypothetical protein